VPHLFDQCSKELLLQSALVEFYRVKITAGTMFTLETLVLCIYSNMPASFHLCAFLYSTNLIMLKICTHFPD
jgi:hypothetical protein